MPIPGEFNVLNVLGASAVALGLTGCRADALVQPIARLRPATGRMTVVAEEPFAVVVDYAHTPGSFERTLPFFRENVRGRLIVVFGSAGERDVEKRAMQGRIANRYADVIVLTDEDPRGEPSMSILEEIASGCERPVNSETLLLIPDRREAIGRAYSIARPGDTVLLLGKGHEATIIGPDGAVPWDEIAVAEEVLRRYQ